MKKFYFIVFTPDQLNTVGMNDIIHDDAMELQEVL